MWIVGITVARQTTKIDQKGRMIVPAKFREEMGRNIVVTLSLDEGILSAYSAERFSGMKAQFSSLNSMEVDVREVTRYIIGEALPCELDSQGRVSISSELWDHIEASAGDEIYVVSYGDKLEISKKTFYESMKKKLGAEITTRDLGKYNVTGL